MGETTQKILGTANEIYKEYLTMSANFKSLEKTFETFTNRMEHYVKALQSENEELRRRVTKLESIVDATFQKSVERALVTVVQEHIEKHGIEGSITMTHLTEGLFVQPEQQLPSCTDQQSDKP